MQCFPFFWPSHHLTPRRTVTTKISLFKVPGCWQNIAWHVRRNHLPVAAACDLALTGPFKKKKCVCTFPRLLHSFPLFIVFQFWVHTLLFKSEYYQPQVMEQSVPPQNCPFDQTEQKRLLHKHRLGTGGTEIWHCRCSPRAQA